MGLNKKFVKMKNDKRAEMGVGTMIVFIAMVLVAAVAASVLISTANTVREQAQSTGDQAINNIATGFIVQDVVGTVTNQQVSSVDIYMRLASGSPNVNMNNVMISVTTDSSSQYLNNTEYAFEKTLTVQTGFEDYVLGQGDLAKITIDNLTVGYNSLVTIKIIPAYGQMTLITFTTPEQYSSGFITLS